MSSTLLSVQDYVTDVRTILLDKVVPYRYPDDSVDDGEQGEGRGVLRIGFGTTPGVVRDAAVGLVSVAGGTARPAVPGRDEVAELLALVVEYGQAATVGGDTARGRAAMGEAKREAGRRFAVVRERLLGLLYPGGGPDAPAG